MIQHYQLIQASIGEYSYVSMSTDTARPDDYLNGLEAELCERNYRGKIVFDLLLSNGFRSNRFFSALFDGNRFVVNSFRSLESVSPELEIISCEFYKENYNLVEHNHVLSKPQKFLVKKGRA